MAKPIYQRHWSFPERPVWGDQEKYNCPHWNESCSVTKKRAVRVRQGQVSRGENWVETRDSRREERLFSARRRPYSPGCGRGAWDAPESAHAPGPAAATPTPAPPQRSLPTQLTLSPPLLPAAPEGPWPIPAWGRSRSKPAWWSGKEPRAAQPPAPPLPRLMAAREARRSAGPRRTPNSRPHLGLRGRRGLGRDGAGRAGFRPCGSRRSPPLASPLRTLTAERRGSAAVPPLGRPRSGSWRGGGRDREAGPGFARTSGVRAPRASPPTWREGGGFCPQVAPQARFEVSWGTPRARPSSEMRPCWRPVN